MPTIPDVVDISNNRQKSVADAPDYGFGWKWKVCQIKDWNVNTNVNRIYSNLDAQELMLRHFQYICVHVLVNERFSILKKQASYRKSEEVLDQRIFLKYDQIHAIFRDAPIRQWLFFRYFRIRPEPFLTTTGNSFMIL